MSLPDIIGPISPNGNSMEGIIHFIRQIVPNPISSGIVKATSSGSYLTTNVNDTILSSDTTEWASYDNPDSFIQFDFYDRFVHLTHYSFRGRYQYTFARVWCLYGFNSGEEEDSSKWIRLDLNTSLGSPFCEPHYFDDCGNDNIGTFQIYPHTEGFRYLRWVLVVSSHPTANHISMRGIELFGTVSFNRGANSIATYYLSCNNILGHIFILRFPLFFVLSTLSL